MSHDFFSALWRSAGLAPGAAGGLSRPAAGAAPNAAPAAAEPFDGLDPFDAVESSEAMAPLPPVGAPASPAAPHDLPGDPRQATAASANPHALQAPATAPAGDAHPLVQAALRWVATGATAPPATRPATPAIEPAPSDLARHDTAASDIPPQARGAQLPGTTPATPAEALAIAPRRPQPAADAPVQRMPAVPRSGAETVAAPLRQPRSAVPAATPAHALPRHAEPAATLARTDVHIGTLHVTLDAAATARFAPRTVASVAPEPPRAGAARPEARPGPGRSGTGAGSSLSRSRLPRW